MTPTARMLLDALSRPTPVAAALLAHLACAGAPVRVEPPAPVPCLVRRPPVRPVMHPVGSPTCPKPWESCLTLPDALALAYWRTAVEEWQDDAWHRCGPP